MTQPNPDNRTNLEQTPQTAASQSAQGTMKDLFLLFLGSGLIITLDTWTKELVYQNIPLGKSWLPDSLATWRPYVRIIHLQNKGTAFGLFQDENQINLIIMVVAVIASLFIIWIYPRIEREERTLRAALILQLAGAVGNLISRIRYGYVLDFISVGNFPVFNIADSSITIGLIILILGMFLHEQTERQSSPSESEDSE